MTVVCNRFDDEMEDYVKTLKPETDGSTGKNTQK
jgi:hypothetical protein